ncbi:large ribosomal subunit protein uL23m [Prorops nasuta]|uniref:large ribosomal subunit protein uL23m n=1 Tax=Prorops nasuta TaxID=863751 RepID=UPI0034CE57A7
MSTRWYPIYNRGNPQLRVFLPNFWLKLVKPEFKQPNNVVTFHCCMQMTKYDIKNYLEKIYKIPVVTVRTRIAMGKTYRHSIVKYVVKDDDTKIAYVVLPKDVSFEFPNLFPENKEDDLEKEAEKTSKEQNKLLESKVRNPGLMPWFN